ncbi:PKG_5 [Blepharisma stoltei]|uniref:cGMP-dependent protein kinase n=1 Tax=Blepharisma stoltei TaxID=1481888 RepID=A0AAU9K5X7_9CILI|nr:unnamed protein product [Blepharisma stoltei]
MGGCFSNRPKIKDISSTCKQSSARISNSNLASATMSNRFTTEEVKDNSRPGSANRKAHKKGAHVKNIQRKASIITEATTAAINTRDKTLEEMIEIREALNQHFIFNSLPDEVIDVIVSMMKLFVLEPNQLVYAQDQMGSHFFVVTKGKLEIKVKNEPKGVITKGMSFGELALMHDSKRTNSVYTIERTLLWGIDRYEFRNAVASYNSQKFEENRKFIDSVPLLQILTNAQKEALLAVLKSQSYFPGQKIVTEGEPGDLFYIIKEGTVSCYVQGKIVRQLGKGDFFGEQALLYNSLRTATIVSNTKVGVLSLCREDLISVLGDQLQLIIYKNSQRIAIESSPHLKDLTKNQEEAVIQKMKVVSYQNGEIIINKGMPKGHKLWLVVKGAVIAEESGKRILSLHCIGDEELINPIQSNYEENYIAEGSVDIEEISRAEFETCIGGKLNNIKSHNEVLKIMRNVQLFRALPTNKLESLVNMIYVQTYGDKQVIFHEFSLGDAFYIVKSGQVDIIKDNTVLRTVAKHGYFGERSIINNEKRTATVAASGKAKVWVLNREDFLNLIDEGIRHQLLKRMELQDDSITLPDLSIIKILGKGMFGNVFMAINKNKGTLYALKTVNRAKIRSYDLYTNLLLERHILLQIDHPFIMKLVKTFKDEERVYFLTELVRGKDLFDVLREMNLLTDSDTKFFSSCILMILEHIHERGIIYRDLKPENIMIDEDGYPKLIDFGTAKVVEGRTYTVVGTPHYMAPEVILGKGYGLSADYWCLGVMIYEFVVGSMPFGDEEEEPYAVYEQVLKAKLIYPHHTRINAKCKEVLEKLLEKNPVMRGTIETIKAMKWFEDIDWDAMLGKQIKPPYIPRLPNQSAELNQAMKSKVSLTAVISKEEAQDSFEIPRGRGKPPPTAWDEVF